MSNELYKAKRERLERCIRNKESITVKEMEEYLSIPPGDWDGMDYQARKVIRNRMVKYRTTPDRDRYISLYAWLHNLVQLYGADEEAGGMTEEEGRAYSRAASLEGLLGDYLDALEMKETLLLTELDLDISRISEAAERKSLSPDELYAMASRGGEEAKNAGTWMFTPAQIMAAADHMASGEAEPTYRDDSFTAHKQFKEQLENELASTCPDEIHMRISSFLSEAVKESSHSERQRKIISETLQFKWDLENRINR